MKANRAQTSTQAPLLAVRGLTVDYDLGSGRKLRAVDGLDLDLGAGEVVGLVGESGCGKSSAARALVGLEAARGSVRLAGEELLGGNRQAWRTARRQLQMVFQDPFASLDPRFTAGACIREPLDHYRIGGHHQRRARVGELMARVGLDPASADRYPHEFSGGQRQRIGIARALALEPAALVCDEPVSALDVSVQAQVLNLLAQLRRDHGLALLLIAHDLAVVRHLADRVAVMYLGRVVEIGPAKAVFGRPRHPYTRSLMAAVPVPDPAYERTRERFAVLGETPSPEHRPPGCAYAPRCPHATAACRHTPGPRLEGAGTHRDACARRAALPPISSSRPEVCPSKVGLRPQPKG